MLSLPPHKFIGNSMKKCLLNIVMGSLIFLGGCSKEGNFEFFEGGSLDIDNPGAFLVINYWAKWCAPCREEIPELNALQDEYRNQIIIAGVNFDQPIDTVLHEEKKVLGVLFPTLKSDPRIYLKLPPVTVLPETLILNSDGELLHRLIGPQTKESIAALISEKLTYEKVQSTFREAG